MAITSIFLMFLAVISIILNSLLMVRIADLDVLNPNGAWDVLNVGI